MKTRDLLPAYFKSLGFHIGAEVGVFKGDFTKKFCEAGFKMFAVDPWNSYDANGRASRGNESNELLYEQAKKTLEPYNDCTIIRKASMDAVHHFKDERLDFVYIDGDHSFRHIANDIQEWTWKVRKGGIVAGHDYKYNRPDEGVSQVGLVVDAFVKAFGIKNLQIIGEKDRAASWFFIRE